VAGERGGILSAGGSLDARNELSVSSCGIPCVWFGD